MLSIHGIQDINDIYSGHFDSTGNYWVEFRLLTTEGPTRLTLYSPAENVAQVAAGLREVADALEGLAPALPETVSLEDPEVLHNTLSSIFGDDK